MVARQIAAAENRLTGAEVTSNSSAKEPKGARIRKIVMAASRSYLYIVKIKLEAEQGAVKLNLYSVKNKVMIDYLLNYFIWLWSDALSGLVVSTSFFSAAR